MYKNKLRKEIIKNVIYVGIILLVACFFTYKIYNKFQTNRDVDYNSESLDIVYHDQGDKISITKPIPMTDSVGLSTNGYSISIKNNLTINAYYKIIIEDDPEYSELNTIPKEDIRISIKINKENNKIYNYNEIEDGLILESELEALKKDDITIRMWINKDSTLPTNTDLQYHGIIKVSEEKE